MFFHWQNLNDRLGSPHHPRKGWPVNGRCWLHWGERSVAHFEWNLWSRFCGVSIGRGEEEDLQCHLAFPPFSFWFGIALGWRSRTPKQVEVCIHDWAVWWRLWRDPMGGWDRSVPKWRDGNFDLPDFLFGRTKYSKVELEQKEVVIPMPEGPYQATAALERCTWKRPRWFAKTRDSVWMTIHGNGIPHQGKGENFWDCGEDGLCGIGGDSYEHAIARAVESVLESRKKYDGNLLAQYPNPARSTT